MGRPRYHTIMVAVLGAMPLSSAAGVLALLEEEEPRLVSFAMQQLNKIVDIFWTEISDFLPKIEELYERDDFPDRNLAALVVSKVYYHLGEYDESLSFALRADERFADAVVSTHGDYMSTLLTKCIDAYVAHRVEEKLAGDEFAARLEVIMDRVFTRCFEDNQYRQAVGIAMESRRLDIIKKAIQSTKDSRALLEFLHQVCMSTAQNREFRNSVLRLIVEMYEELPHNEKEFSAMGNFLMVLDDDVKTSELLIRLAQGTATDVLLSFQMGFDMADSATQSFRNRVKTHLLGADVQEGSEVQANITKLVSLLSREVTIEHYLEFLHRANNTDKQILDNTKENIGMSRNAVSHSALIMAHGFMQCGTMDDKWLGLDSIGTQTPSANLEWLSRASNWALFSAYATRGVIHRGNIKVGKNGLPMPNIGDGSSVTSNAYSEGGNLFALGLIHANHHDDDVITHLLEELQRATVDGVQVVRHGAALGLGVAAMASGSSRIYDELMKALNYNDAVTGEAVAIAMGLVNMGSGNLDSAVEMLAYARETQHEKIIRGLSLGMSMVVYGLQETAKSFIEQLTSDADAWVRVGAMYCTAMAYCGTRNNDAIQCLLHIAVSDTSNDVRRAAVTSIGFVLCRNASQCPSLVSLLSESYNPHVRCGAAAALGIACAGTGLTEAVALLETLTDDPVDFVRQAALISLAMVLMQQTEAGCPKVKQIRALYAKVSGESHEDELARMGAIYAQGIIDAGGRNMTISMETPSGNLNMQAAAGLLNFWHFWYWHPLANMLSLAFTPTAMIGLNQDLKMPKMSFISNAAPSLFACPKKLEPKKEKVAVKVSTAMLSMTSRKLKGKKTDEPAKETQAAGGTAMEVDESSTSEKEKDNGKEKAEPEPKREELDNPARVLPWQVKHISLQHNSAYTPINKGNLSGIQVMVRGSSVGDPEELVELEAPAVLKEMAKIGGADEPQPPASFEYTE